MSSTQHDFSNPISIEAYAKQLEGKTLSDFLSHQDINGKNKGNFGLLLETFFGIPANCISAPDFSTIGGAKVELKSLPLKKLKNGELRAKERLVFNVIDYMSICNETWETSSFLAKNRLILLVAYLYESEKSAEDFVIQAVRLLQLNKIPDTDFKIMQQDWTKIVGMIKNGHAEDLSEGTTLYLGACTKGTTASSSFRTQPFSKELAKQRAFSWKNSYINHVLDDLFCKRDKHSVSIYGQYTGPEDFESLVISLFGRYINKQAEEIAIILRKEYDCNGKGFLALISKAILGADEHDKIQEFENANITLKTVCLEPSGTLKESISFPYIHYDTIITENWENSILRETLDKKFFFVIFKKTETGKRILRKVMFWNIQEKILETNVRQVWEKTKARIIAEDFDNLPSMADDPVCHVRPHGRDSSDTTITASGKFIGKKCFWLKNTFIQEQISGR